MLSRNFLVFGRKRSNVERFLHKDAFDKMKLAEKKRNRSCDPKLLEYLSLPPGYKEINLHCLQDFCYYLGMKKGFTVSIEEIQRVRDFIQLSKEMFETIQYCYQNMSFDDKKIFFNQDSFVKIYNPIVEQFHITVYAFLILHQDIDRFVLDVRNKYREVNHREVNHREVNHREVNHRMVNHREVQLEKNNFSTATERTEYVVLSNPKFLLVLRELFFQETYRRRVSYGYCHWVTLSEFVEFLVNVILYPHFYFLSDKDKFAFNELILASKSSQFPSNPLKKDWMIRFYQFLNQIQDFDENFLNSFV